ncbi:MAG: hypothetical protein AAFX99_06670, partial [Myxococcota bacterium]
MPSQVKQRLALPQKLHQLATHAIALVALCAAAILGASACTRWILPPSPPPDPNVHRLSPTTAQLTLAGGDTLIKVHAVPTGNIAVKEAHAVNGCGKDASFMRRFLAILTDRTFAAPMPIMTYIIEHPEGVFV